MDKMLKNQEKTNKYDNIVSGVFAPLFLYYVIHNVAVIGGLAILELAVGKVEMLNLGEEGLFYARTVVRMAGMALGGVAVYPYYVREQAKNKKKSDYDEDDEDDDDEEKLSIFDKFKDVLTTSIEESGNKSRYWWVEEIENPNLVRSIRSLSTEQLELLTLVVIDGYGQVEIAELMKVSQSAISQRLATIKKILKVTL